MRFSHDVGDVCHCAVDLSATAAIAVAPVFAPERHSVAHREI
jgi:hypothetical protein